MTSAQHIKESLMGYLAEHTPDESIAIVDGKQRADIDLPTLTVDCTGTEAHSTTLSMVHRASISCVLRCHTGDEDDADIPAWIDTIESVLFDVSGCKAAITSDQVKAYDFVYSGSSQDWDESVLEVSFSAEVLFARLS